jgi:TRAP-type C4-dicarboxylate transport system permease small subunit
VRLKGPVGLVVRWLDRAAVLALLAMMLLTTGDVVLRRLASKPVLGVTELVEFALGIAIFAALPGVFARGANIVVDMGDAWWPRAVGALKRLAAAASLITLGLLTWHMWQPLKDIVAYGDTSADLQIPKLWFMAPAYAGVVLGALVALAVLLAGEVESPADAGDATAAGGARAGGAAPPGAAR